MIMTGVDSSQFTMAEIATSYGGVTPVTIYCNICVDAAQKITMEST
jgi:hypothetical protein